MIPGNLIFNVVSIKRRLSPLVASRDALNNPIFGNPTSSPLWTTVYSGIAVRFAFSQNKISFALGGERANPYGVMYIDKEYSIYNEDRVLTSDGIEYVVTSVAPGYLFNELHHWEAELSLP